MTETTTKTKQTKKEVKTEEMSDLDLAELSEVEEESSTKRKGAGKKDRYFEAVGRRKTSVGRVRLFTKVNGITINDKPLAKYFPTLRLQNQVLSPLEKMKLTDKLGAVIKVNGGGLSSQAEAARLGIARALVIFNPIFKKRLRRLGFLTRDSRIVERKKYGLKKARRAPQWSKR